MLLSPLRVVRSEDDVFGEPAPVPEVVHDAPLEETLRRLMAPPPPPVRSAPRPTTDRATYGLD